MNKLQCPYCGQDVCVEVEISKILKYVIKERIDIVEADGSVEPPTFLLAPPKEPEYSTQNTLIRCTKCYRRYYEIARDLKINKEELRVELENFSEKVFRSYDLGIVVSPESRPFVLKHRPKDICKI